jgi:hypothetical protein
MPHFLVLMDHGSVRSALKEPRLERAIGVVYKPKTERASHYFKARLSEQFDTVIHVDAWRNGRARRLTCRKRILREFSGGPCGLK